MARTEIRFRAAIYVDAETKRKILDVVRKIGPDRMTATSYADNILRWHIENGTIIIPKSVHADRQKQNLDLFGFVLSPAEHAAIDALDGPTRAGHDPMTFTYA